jgi:hypothetical protein
LLPVVVSHAFVLPPTFPSKVEIVAGKQKEQRNVVSLLLTGVAVINKVVFPPASLVGKPSMGALIEGRF